MHYKGGKRISSAHLIALLALVAALASGAYAASKAPKNSVTSKSVKDASLTGNDIKDNRLTGADVDEGSLGEVPSATAAESVPNGSITGAKIADGAITGAKVADDSLGGADIDESSLGLPSTKYFNVRRAAGSTPFFQFMDFGGMQLDLTCDATGVPSLFFSQPGGFGVETDIGNSDTSNVRTGALALAGASTSLTNNSQTQWLYEWHADDSTVLSISAAIVSNNGAVNTDCVVFGSATLQES